MKSTQDLIREAIMQLVEIAVVWATGATASRTKALLDGVQTTLAQVRGNLDAHIDD